MVVYRESLLLFGGIIENSVSNALLQYSLGPDKELTDLELNTTVPPKFGHSMTLVRNVDNVSCEMVIAAGMSLDPDDCSTIIVHLLDTLLCPESS